MTDEKSVGLKDVEMVFVFDAPVEAVWNAFTDPKIETQWTRCIVPSGSTDMEFLQHDLRVGGKYHIKATSPEKRVMYNTGTYEKIVPFKELVYTESFADEKGNILPGSAIGLTYYIPPERRVEITFEPLYDGTKIKLIYRHNPANEHSDIVATQLAISFVQLANMIERPRQ